MEITDQGLDSEADIRRRLEDQPRSRQETAPGRFGRPGVNPVSSIQLSAASQVVSLHYEVHAERVVETRRLELLTLSLQRRCSAD